MPTNAEPTAELDERFSEPGAEAPPWADVDAALGAAEMFWLSTTRADGRPHVTPLPAIWRGGRLHVCTGRKEQKFVNLDRDGRCVLATGNDQLRSGLSVVVEGSVAAVTDADELQALADRWKAELDWDFTVSADGQGFDDGDGRTATVFALAPDKVLAFGTAPYTQTRYTGF